MIMYKTLSYFAGEQHRENYEQIVHLVEEFEYSIRVYESRESFQFDFQQTMYRVTVTIKHI
jgi:hypothetical protein